MTGASVIDLFLGYKKYVDGDIIDEFTHFNYHKFNFVFAVKNFASTLTYR